MSTKMIPQGVSLSDGALSQVDYAGDGGFGYGRSRSHIYPNLFEAPPQSPGYAFPVRTIDPGATILSSFVDVSGFEFLLFSGTRNGPADIAGGVFVSLAFFIDPLFSILATRLNAFANIATGTPGLGPFVLPTLGPGASSTFILPTPFLQIELNNMEATPRDVQIFARAFSQA